MVITCNNNFDEFCPECSGNVISVYERGEMVCSQCGLILTEKGLDISHSGVRAYTKSDIEKKVRTGSPMSIMTPDITLCTLIEKNKIQNPDLKRAAYRDSYISWEAKNMLIATNELKRMSHNLHLPDYVKKAALKLYKKAFRENILRGRSIVGIMASCVIFACKEFKIPRSFQEISEESSIGKNKIKKYYSTLVEKLNLKVAITDPVSLIPRYIAALGLKPEIEKMAIGILRNYLNSRTISGVNPKGLCGGVIYILTKFKNIKISQKIIANTIGITEVTLRSRYREILAAIDILVQI